MNLVKRFFKEEEGQGLAEYALILALIVIVVIGFMGGLGNKIGAKFKTVSDTLQ